MPRRSNPLPFQPGVLFLVALALALGLMVTVVFRVGNGRQVAPASIDPPGPVENSAYPPLLPAATPPAHPYPVGTPDAIGQATLAAKETHNASATLTGAPSPFVGATLEPAEATAAIQQFKDAALITLEDSGQTVMVALGARFWIFLDDEGYPVRMLTCEPEWVMGAISNGWFRGPRFYPAYFEATVLGSCVLKNRDFAVTIVVVEPSPEPQVLPSGL